MQIEMLKSTSWDHQFYKEGDGPEKTDKLPEDVKKRWVNRKIAKLVGDSVDDDNGDAKGNGAEGGSPPKGPSYNELKERAKELGIEGFSKMKKEELAAAIEEAEAAQKAAELEEHQKTERLAALRIRAEELGIEGFEEMDEESLIAAIEEATQKGAGKE